MEIATASGAAELLLNCSRSTERIIGYVGMGRSTDGSGRTSAAAGEASLSSVSKGETGEKKRGIGVGGMGRERG